MTGKIPANFYEEFLKDESNFTSNSLQFSQREALISWSQSSLLRFGAISLSYPFESMRLLRQIQFGNAVETTEKAGFYAAPEEPEVANRDITQEELEKQEIENHFLKSSLADAFNPTKPPTPPPALIPTMTSKWPLMLNKQCSMWETTSFVAKYQGLPSLWNGLLASWFHDLASESLFVSLNRLVPASENHIVPSLLRGVVRFLMTPLDLIKTRMSAQSIFSSEQKFWNVFSALSNVFTNEGGIWGLFPHKAFSLIYSFSMPLLQHVPLHLLSTVAEEAAESLGLPAGIGFASAQFLITIANSVLVSPLDTIRRRLYLQSHHRCNWIYRVPVPDEPYKGFWNCLRRVYHEEGLVAFYQGWSLHLASAIVNFLSTSALILESEYTEDMEAF